jgi:mannitol-specific phosphotransferase system IIBC component
MGDQHELPRPPRQSPRHMMIAGLIITVVSGFLALVLFVATVLAANSCGAFGDACDDYGTTSTDFFVVLALTIVAIVSFIIGLVLSIKGFSRRNRHANCV